MDKKVYEELEQLQNKHWWFVSKKNIITALLDQYINLLNLNSKSKIILDAGCGMGLMLNTLSNYGEVYGMDCEIDALKYCRQKWGDRHILQGMLPDNIPFPDKFADIIVLSDCLEHISDDCSSLIKLRNLLKGDNSFIVLTVPALMGLWSYNDVLVHHYRRYSKKQLEQVTRDAGFCIEMCSYYNFWLFPIIWIIRKLKNLFHIEKDDLKIMPEDNWINKLLIKIFSSEKNWLTKRQLPIGVSLILIATKGAN